MSAIEGTRSDMIMAMATERSFEHGSSELVEAASVSITLSNTEGGVTQFDLRVLFPTAEAISRFFPDFSNQLESDDEGEAVWRFAMLDLYAHHAWIDPHRTRRFSLESFKRCEDLREHAKAVGARRGRVEAEHVVKLAGVAGGEGCLDLLFGAVYKRPVIRVELSPEEYCEFRDTLLDELLDMRADLERMKEDALKEARATLEGHPDLSAEARTEVLDRLQETGFPKLVSDFMRRVSRAAMRAEDAHSSKFADLVGDCRVFLDDVLRRGDMAVPMGPGEPAGDVGEDEYGDLVPSYLKPEEANAILWKAILRFEEVYGVEPVRDAQLIEIAEEDLEEEACGPDGADPGASEAGAEDTQPGQVEQYLYIRAAYASQDVLEKWNALVCIATQLANRNECVRLAVREAEEVYHWVAEQTFLRMYRRIRKQISRAERRAFLLLHTRLPALGGRIASLDPVIASFFTGMDSETQALVILVLAFRIREWGGQRLDEQLAERWRAYLRLYPLWVELIRSDDRARWPRRKHAERRWADLSGLAERGTQDPALQALMKEGEDVGSWVGKYCDDEEGRCVLRQFVDGWSQARIAQQEGISQQAVSKRLQRALGKIRRGLAR